MTPVGTQSIWKSSTRLADGREIVYFDEEPGLGRAAVPDTRPLPPQNSDTLSRVRAEVWLKSSCTYGLGAPYGAFEQAKPPMAPAASTSTATRQWRRSLSSIPASGGPVRAR